MIAFRAAALVFASLLPQEAPLIDDQPLRVCLDAPRAIFQVENRAAEPIVATVSLERWSEEGDAPGWTLVQADVTQREAQPKQVKSVKLDARQRRNFVWELKKRVAPPSLVTGRHRVVVTYGHAGGEPAGTVTHEFVLLDCGA